MSTSESKLSKLENYHQQLIDKFNLKNTELILSDNFRMSEVLRDFLAPELDDENDSNLIDFYIKLGIIGWNTSFYSKKEQRQIIDEMINDLELNRKAGEGAQELISFLQKLIIRRKRYFSAFKIIILDYELEEKIDQFNLRVFSAPI